METTEAGPEAPSFSENEKRVLVGVNLSSENLTELLAGPPFAEGSYAVLFDLQPHRKDLVAKIGKGGKADAARGARENVALRLLRIRGFREAPRVHGYMSPSNVLFEEKIEGAPIENFDERTISDLAEALAKLHSIKLDSYGKPLEKREQGTRMDCLRDGIATLRNLASVQVGDAEIVTLTSSLLEKTAVEAERAPDAFSKSDFTLIHFDLNPGNILRSAKNGGLVLVDWEQASAGDNAMDIAKLFLKCEFSAQQKELFLQKYESRLPEVDPGLEERLRVYEPLVLVNSVLWRLRTLASSPGQGTEDEEFRGRVKSGLEKELARIKELLQ